MRILRFFGVLSCALALVSCAGNNRSPMREPVKLDISLHAMHDVNPDGQQRAAPIVVRLYELRSTDAFAQADFYSLQDKDKAVLADDLVVRDQFLLRPGQSQTVTRAANDATTALGVIAAYRDLPNSVWRTVWPLPSRPAVSWYSRAPQLRITVDLDANAVRITDISSKAQ
ncbi:type VI secretion system lipoprotein TssJ [Paraburkholderia sp. Tr-20389]|uniref:type VI secretion system lipoprotein TssJ n=1 Tax=Paraburkholderia sp. Tr-20389 TaxID=2703903 RepID=UPI00197EA344|nr:type VI secretion system lipoprotein TssJ [Paraburkholderia sp. Tr-20389]MBN3752369.1 type VI secretion system lipoprotein TssJ [Paraburkholderia sp. Tr-20389]